MELSKQNEETDAQKQRGKYQLKRVQTIVDVLFALMIFRIFTLMPDPEIDHFDKTNVTEVLTHSYLNYATIAIGMILLLLYWGLNNVQFNNLKRTDGKHAVLTILQVFFLMLYLYFIRLDMQLDAPVIVLAMESVTLAIAGFISLYTWYYSIKNNLISSTLTKDEIGKTYLKLMPEPIVSVLTIPFAQFGPGIWTASWLLLIPVGMLSKYLRNKMMNSEQNH